MNLLIKPVFLVLVGMFAFIQDDCSNTRPANTSAKDEQAHTEHNQRRLNTNQPPPDLDWSLERDNISKRMVMMNDRAINFFLYVFVQGSPEPVGYYIVNKVSSVDSQLTNTMQIVRNSADAASYGFSTLPSPAEDGSYGTNGDAMYGFTPEGIYIEVGRMGYICSSAPLNFHNKPPQLNVISPAVQVQIDEMMKRVEEKIKKK